MPIDPVRELERVLEHESQSAFAARKGIEQSLVSMVLNGKRAPSPQMLRALGLERVVTVTYRKINGR
jgi:transcriptional regulator with XRE-family HTH domain